MKRFVSFATATFAGLMLATVAPAAAQAPKIGYVDFQRISQEAPGVTTAQQTLQTEGQKFEAELQKLGTQLDSMRTNFEKQQATLSATVRQQRQQEFQQRLTAAQQREAQIRQALQQRQQELFAPIEKRVVDTIEAMRKEGGYALILGRSESGIIAADPALDLTARVLDRLKTTPTAGR